MNEQKLRASPMTNKQDELLPNEVWKPVPICYANPQHIIEYRNVYEMTEAKTKTNIVPMYTQDQLDEAIKAELANASRPTPQADEVKRLEEAFDELTNCEYTIEVRDNVNEAFLYVNGIMFFQDYYGITYVKGMNHTQARAAAISGLIKQVALSHKEKAE